jgi:alcohol dehydrogenase class IV
LHIPTKLADYGVEEKDIPDLVAGAMKQARLFVPNPRDLTENDIEGIYRVAL